MATRADLNYNKTNILSGKDNIIIVDNFQSKRGGVTLDVTDFTADVINAGHVIISDGTTYKPMPVSGTAYDELPEGYNYVGILIVTIPTSKPFAGVMYRGTVNEKAADLAYTADMKTALSLIKFVED